MSVQNNRTTVEVRKHNSVYADKCDKAPTPKTPIRVNRTIPTQTLYVNVSEFAAYTQWLHIASDSTHMPPNHQKYLQWTGDRFLKWAEKIGPNTKTVIAAILNGLKVEQQGYKSCMAILKLADKYSSERLESACKKALSFTPRPSLKHIQTILSSGQDQEPAEQETSTSSSQYGFTRGDDYYKGRNGKC